MTTVLSPFFIDAFEKKDRFAEIKKSSSASVKFKFKHKIKHKIKIKIKIRRIATNHFSPITYC